VGEIPSCFAASFVVIVTVSATALTSDARAIAPQRLL
jgi:hypothetical protein